MLDVIIWENFVEDCMKKIVFTALAMFMLVGVMQVHAAGGFPNITFNGKELIYNGKKYNYLYIISKTLR